MADFSYEKKYIYDFESSKYKDVLYRGDNISLLTNNVNYISASGIIASASYATTASYAIQAGNASTININSFGSPVESYLLMSNVIATSGVAIGGDTDLRYNSSTNRLTVGTVSATSLTGSILGDIAGTASWASNSITSSKSLILSGSFAGLTYLYGGLEGSNTPGTARTLNSTNLTYNTTTRLLNASSSYALTAATASYVLNAISASFTTTASYINTLNQNVIITGSLAIGTGSIGTGENNLLLGPAPAGGTGEGGQIALLAVGGTYTSSSFLDNYQNQFRILSGPGAVSNTGVLAIDLDTRNATFQGAVTASAFNGLPNDYLYVNRNIDQTIVSGNWANRDIIFNNSVVSKGISYNTGTGLASLTGGKVYRITARLAWGAAATYLFQFSCYNSSNTILGPTVEIVQSTNGTNNISDGTLDFIYAPVSNVDIKIRTTGNATALSGEYIRGDLNTQLIIQQIA